MNKIIFSCYELGSGKFTCIKQVLGSDEMLINVPDQRGAVLGRWDTDAHYVDVLGANETLPRPVVAPMTAFTYDLATLPSGAKLVVTDVEGVSTDVPAQIDTLELIDGGTYQVKSVSPFPYIDFEVEVIV